MIEEPNIDAVNRLHNTSGITHISIYMDVAVNKITNSINCQWNCIAEGHETIIQKVTDKPLRTLFLSILCVQGFVRIFHYAPVNTKLNFVFAGCYQFPST